MAQHLIGAPFIGVFAVHGFFILSGFLMTTIMHETYGYTLRGFFSFWVNRLIRLYPVYFCVLGLASFLLLVYGEAIAREYRAVIYFPSDWRGWLANLSMVYPHFFPGTEAPRLSPATWALTIELFFYVCISMGLSRSRFLSLFFFAASATYILITFLFDLGAVWRFGAIASGALPFSLGALLYHYKAFILNKLKRFQSPWTIAVIFGIYVANPAMVEMGERITGIIFLTPAYFLNYFIHFLLIALLIEPKSFPIPVKWDKAIGDLSYPIYLIHWQAGFSASMFLFQKPVLGTSLQGLTSFALAVVLAIVASQILVSCIDQPVNRVRSRIKRWVKKSPR